MSAFGRRGDRRRQPRKLFKSDAGRIRVLIRSLDSVQNAALMLPIERQLLSQFSTAHFLTFEHMHLGCALRGVLCEIVRNACVMRLTVTLANEYVNIVEIFH